MSIQSVGQSIPRIDALGKVTGKTPYSGDLSMQGMLYMKILFAERPHARILRIITDRAETSPGVVAIYTARDVPFNAYGPRFLINPLCGPLADSLIPPGMVGPTLCALLATGGGRGRRI
jgi:CO/xanthine dehydrogenase Mo-binding subunit